MITKDRMTRMTLLHAPCYHQSLNLLNAISIDCCLLLIVEIKMPLIYIHIYWLDYVHTYIYLWLHVAKVLLLSCVWFLHPIDQPARFSVHELRCRAGCSCPPPFPTHQTQISRTALLLFEPPGAAHCCYYYVMAIRPHYIYYALLYKKKMVMFAAQNRKNSGRWSGLDNESGKRIHKIKSRVKENYLRVGYIQ